jgi:hypothetical protein
MVDPVTRQPGVFKELHAAGLHHVRKNVIADAAQALGMDKHDLKKALAGGQSLSDVAASKGVSQDDLLAAIKQGITASGTPVDGTDLDALAQQLAAFKPKSHAEDAPPTDPTDPTDPTGDATQPNVSVYA